jgi:hypothetical protein
MVQYIKGHAKKLVRSIKKDAKEPLPENSVFPQPD